MDNGVLSVAVLVVYDRYCLYTAAREGVEHVHPVAAAADAANENSARMLNDAFVVLMCPVCDQLLALVPDWQTGLVLAQYGSSSDGKMALVNP